MLLLAEKNFNFKTFLLATLISSLFLMTLCNPLPPPSAKAQSTMPFAPGEKLRFVLMWTFIPAGEAVLEVLPMQTINGQRAYHFRFTAQSNAFVDLIYKVRDRIDAYASADMSHAIKYIKKQREGKHHQDLQVRFDTKNLLAEYWDGKKKKITAVPPGTFDPLGAFYFTRLADFRTDGLIVCPVSSGEKWAQGEARIIGQETIEIVSGTYKTYLIEPDMKHVGGIFKKEKKAKIQLWVTADQYRIPVKIASKVAIGSFVGELVTMERNNS